MASYGTLIYGNPCGIQRNNLDVLCRCQTKISGASSEVKWNAKAEIAESLGQGCRC